MGEPKSRTYTALDDGVSGSRSNEIRHLIDIDQQIFERLNQGDPHPFKLTLRDGRTIIGEPKGIARRFGDEIASVSWGRVLLATADGQIELSYQDIMKVA